MLSAIIQIAGSHLLSWIGLSSKMVPFLTEELFTIIGAFPVQALPHLARREVGQLARAARRAFNAIRPAHTHNKVMGYVLVIEVVNSL